MLAYFAGCTTTAKAKSLYRELAFANHPDLGGTEDAMKAINEAYHQLLHSLNGETLTGTDGKEHVYRYSHDVEQAVMDMVLTLVALRMPAVEIEIIGQWVWVRGDTRPHKEDLKALKCRWHNKRQCWYWHRPSYRRTYSNMSWSEMRWAFGSRTVDEPTPAHALT